MLCYVIMQKKYSRKFKNRVKRGGMDTVKTPTFYNPATLKKNPTAAFYNTSKGEGPITPYKPRRTLDLSPGSKKEAEDFFAGPPPEKREEELRKKALTEFDKLTKKYTELQESKKDIDVGDCPDGSCTVSGGRKSHRCKKRCKRRKSRRRQ